MNIILSSQSSKPIYEQIADQIKANIMNGELKPGEPLPSMRRLANDLHVSVITTQRAYDELSKDGFITVIPSKGAFISLDNKDFILEESRRRVEKHLKEAVDISKSIGLGKSEIISIIDILFDDNE